MKTLKNEKGTIMIEATFAMICCMIVLMIVMGMGFLVYQRSLMIIVANQVSEEVSATYKLLDCSDAAEVTKTDVTGVKLYRNIFFCGTYKNANKTKAETLASTRLTQSSMAYDDGGFKVTLDRIGDDIGRYHYKITVTNNYTYLFGGVLSYWGIDGLNTLSATTYSVGTDVSGYYGSVTMTSYLLNKATKEFPILGIDSTVVGIINTVLNWFK